MDQSIAPLATRQVIYDIDCGEGRHPICLAVTRWGEVRVAFNPCDALPGVVFDFSRSNCRTTVRSHLASLKVFHQHFLPRPSLAYRGSPLWKQLDEQLRDFWSPADEQLAAAACDLLGILPAASDDALRTALASDDLAQRWASLVLIDLGQRRAMAADILAELPFLPFALALRAVVILDKLGEPAPADTIAVWSQNRDVIAPLRQLFIDHLPAIGSARVASSLVANWICTACERRGDYPSVEAIPDLAHTALREMLASAKNQSRAAFLEFAAMMLLEQRNRRDCVYALLADVGGHDCSLWLELLEHFRWSVRVGAVEVLTRLGDPRSAAPLVTLLESRPPREIHQAAAVAVASILPKLEPDDPADRQLLGRALRVESVNVVRAAIARLAACCDPRITALLLQGLAGSDPHLVAVIAEELGERRVLAAILPLCDIVDSRHPLVRRETLALHDLVRELSADHPQAVAWWQRGLLCRDPQVAVLCAERLGGVDTAAASAALRDGLAHAVPAAQAQIALELERIRDPSAIAPLLECLANCAVGARRQIAPAVISLLGELHDTPAHLALAVAALQGIDISVSVEAANVLARLGDATVISPLEQAATRGRPDLTNAATRAIAQCRGALLGRTTVGSMPYVYRDSPTSPRGQRARRIMQRMKS